MARRVRGSFYLDSATGPRRLERSTSWIFGLAPGSMRQQGVLPVWMICRCPGSRVPMTSLGTGQGRVSNVAGLRMDNGKIGEMAVMTREQ